MSAADRSAYLEQVLVQLQSLEPAAEDRPALVIFPPGTRSVIRGNEWGYIRLAITALKASQGEYQSFTGEPWIRSVDLDWAIDGLELDPLAQFDLAEFDPHPTLVQRVFGGAIALLLLLCLFVGFITLARWTLHLLSR